MDLRERIAETIFDTSLDSGAVHADIRDAGSIWSTYLRFADAVIEDLGLTEEYVIQPRDLHGELQPPIPMARESIERTRQSGDVVQRRWVSEWEVQ